MRPFLLLMWMAFVLGAAPAANAATVTIELGAKITAVELKAQRVTISRGAKAGIKVDTVGEIYPMRESVEFNERIARGKVLSVTPDSAIVALEAVVDTVDVGAYFLYSAPVDDQLAKSPLFRIVALGVELRGIETKDPILTTEQMLADPSPALRDKALDKALAEMRANRDVIDSVGRISGGKYHGRRGGEIADTLTRDELNEFFVFVESYPGKYVNRHWRVAEIFFTWVISKTPSGEPERKLRAASRLIAQARQSERDGKLDEARKQWEAVLRDIPDHKQARTHIDNIYKMQLWMRQVTADKDNTWARAQLAAYLFDIGAYALSLPHVQALIAAKYEVFQQTKLKAKLLAGQGKFREAEQILAKLVKEQPQNTDAAHWLAYVKARGRLEKAPDDPAARLALARVYHDEEAWDDALLEYRRVLDLKGATAAHKETVKQAQTKITIQRDLAAQINFARSAIQAHDLTRARGDIDDALALAKKLGDATRAPALLEDLADAAGTASEEEFRMELMEKRASTAKDEMAQRVYAGALVRANRYDEAAAIVAKLREEHPYLLASIARGRGDLAALEKHSAKHVAARMKSTWPYLNMAVVEAARGNWQEAIDHVRKAQDLKDPHSAFAVRWALNASLRGLQASEALRSNPTSPRERLRLVRALAGLGLVKAANAEVAKLPADGTWRSDGYWAIAGSPDSEIPLADTVAAMRAGKANTPARKRVLARYEAQLKLRDKPKDEANRLALAKLQLQTGDANRALAVLGPLMTAKPLPPAVSDLARDAHAYLDVMQHLDLASDARSRDEYATATKLVLEYQAVMDRIGEPLGQASAREARINILTDQGKYAEAIKISEESFAMIRADGDPELISIGEGHVARLQASIGTNEPLRRALEKNLKDCDDRDSDICLFNAHYELSKVHEDDGNQAEAIEHARKAWATADRLGDSERARGARLALARRNYTAGRFADANELLVKLLVDARNMTDTDDEQRILLLLGAIAMYRGNGPAAREKFAAVYDLGTRVGHNPWRAVGRRMEGLSYLLADHDAAKAEAAFEQAIPLYMGDDVETIQTRAMALSQLATARLRLKKLPGARKAAEEALAIRQRYQRRSDLASAHSLMAEIAVAEGKADAALASTRLAFDLAKTSDNSGLLSDIWDTHAQALVLANKDEEAVAAYEKALDHSNKALLGAGSEAERDAKLKVGSTLEMYRRAVDLLLKLGKTKRAMEILESSRDAQLKQSFDAAAVQTKDAKVRAKLDKYEQARDRVAGLEKQLDASKDKPASQRSASQEKALGEQIAKTKEELKEVALDLKVTHRHLYRALALDPQTLLDRRKELPPGSVIVEYFPASDALYAFIVSAALTQPAVVKVKVTADELAKTIAEFRAAIIQENERTKARDRVEQLGRKLDDWLLQPLRTHLDGATTVILIPFGPLYYVPFDALVVSDAGQPVRYAIEDFRLSVQTATTLEYLLKAPRPRSTGSLLAVSNPDGTLPGAQREVARITKTIPDAKVLGRKDGTVKKFSELVGNYRIVHLATHGLLDADPRKSYLKMSDGQLTVREIAKLGLDQMNELVVLSACESATEQGESAGDELVSLAISFAMAGAPALVASLWEVGDESTADLMAAFYRALEQAGGDRLEALRSAKLNMLRTKQYAPPWYWSSFQLYGDFRTPAAK